MLSYKPPQCSDEVAARVTSAFRDFAAERRQLALRGARIAYELEQSGACYREGAASVSHFAEMNGVPAHEARELVNLGRALANCPAIEADVAAGTIPVSSGAVLGEIGIEQNARGDVGFSLEPGTAPMVRRDDRWIEWAKTKSTKEFRHLFLRRRDEVRAGAPVIPVTGYVTAAVREDIDRAKALASRTAHAALTIGQTMGVVFGDWLGDHDPLRTPPGTRRVPDTATLPESRYVPAEVDRAVRARSDDCCIVPFCDATNWVQRSHRVPHRSGGSREAEQLDLLCDYHHHLYETGAICISGPADAPVITDAYGRSIDERRPHLFGCEGPPPTPGASSATGATGANGSAADPTGAGSEAAPSKPAGAEAGPATPAPPIPPIPPPSTAEPPSFAAPPTAAVPHAPAAPGSHREDEVLGGEEGSRSRRRPPLADGPAPPER